MCLSDFAAKVFTRRTRKTFKHLSILVIGALIFPLAAHAASPWEDAVQKLAAAFTGPIAKALALVAIVIGGLTWAFSEGQDSKRMLAGIVFGCGMALGAVSFLSWLFF